MEKDYDEFVQRMGSFEMELGEEQDMLDEIIEHYGVKGMKWGVRKAKKSGVSPSKGAKQLTAMEKSGSLKTKAGRKAYGDLEDSIDYSRPKKSGASPSKGFKKTKNAKALTPKAKAALKKSRIAKAKKIAGVSLKVAIKGAQLYQLQSSLDMFGMSPIHNATRAYNTARGVGDILNAATSTGYRKDVTPNMYEIVTR